MLNIMKRNKMDNIIFFSDKSGASVPGKLCIIE